MKKKFTLLMLSLVIAITLSACHLGHKWMPATCINPQTCSECGKTKGEALGHDWIEADCLAPKTCSRCGATVGSALGHDWIEADCTKPKTCRRCGVTEGEPLEHVWKEADCEHPRTCVNCGATEGEALGHTVGWWRVTKQPTCAEDGIESGSCSVCGKTVERPVKHLDHKPGSWETITKPTSTADGRRVRKCYLCGKVLETETIRLSPEEKIQAYKNECSNYTYESVARNPDAYRGNKARVSGRVIQVLEDGNDYTLRVAVGGSYNNVILVTYTKSYGESRILDNDWITFYGTWNGTYTYESIMGQSITVPYFEAKYS